MNKRIINILATLCTCIMFNSILNIPTIAKADDDTNAIYISENGSDSGSGTEESPFASLKKALEVAEDNSIIYLNSNIIMGVDNTITKNITIKSNNSKYTLKREDGAEGYCLLVQNGCTLNLENIIIDGNSNTSSWFPVIRVENSTLNIKEGAIVQNNNSHSEGAISLAGSTFNMQDGEIKNNISSMHSGAIFANNSQITISGNARITNNTVTAKSEKWPLTDDEKNGAHGGAIYLEEESTLNILENAEISNNSCVLYGGGVFSWNSTINLNGGKITNNNAIKGAGIYGEGGSKINLVKGEISKNEAKTNKNLADYNENIAGCGAGIMAVDSPVIILDGVDITENKAEINGGGIEIINSTLDMQGGKIDKNTAGINGGGILLTNESVANITAGYITNNVCDLTKFNFDFASDPSIVLGTMETIGSGSEFAAGGIYLHAGCTLNLSGTIITKNTNDQSAGINTYPDKSVTGYSGNGIALCPTANAKIYAGAIYGNGNDDEFDIVLSPTSLITEYNYEHGIDKESISKLYNSNFIISGEFCKWTDYEGKNILTGDYVGSKKIGLRAHLSDEAIKNANEKATVFITGNTSRGIFGAGGIVCNGNLNIGVNDSAAIKVEKHAEKNTLQVADTFTFNVKLKGNDIDKKCKTIYINDETGIGTKDIVWTKEADVYTANISLKVNKEGKGYFYLLNIPDKTEFTITEESSNYDFDTKIDVINGEAEKAEKTITGTIDTNSKLIKNYKVDEESEFSIPTALYILYNNDYQPAPEKEDDTTSPEIIPNAGTNNIIITIIAILITMMTVSLIRFIYINKIIKH